MRLNYLSVLLLAMPHLFAGALAPGPRTGDFTLAPQDSAPKAGGDPERP